MSRLQERTCVPCEKGTRPLDDSRVSELLLEIPEWELRGGKLVRESKLKNFRKALQALNRIGEVAEQEGHHPDMALHSWNRIRIELYTHSIGGLSENDFILAAKIDPILESESPVRPISNGMG